ncbi:CUB and sushi domain-containing protein 3 [Holothuria leucospilota]|uniref:CUB and sushi domain-containing protein 3 n=1 Tax=Holothuria leucospilota TaxID=206669 RepID=A0A9Q1HBJ6_HOLLE|nr:CUB and sushi domain-containing protein 3 [Holothuria leucospilota]
MSGNYSCVVYGYSGKYVNVSLHVYARCPDPGLVENGERSLSHENMKSGSFAMYTCNSGYNIDGSSTIGCRADGTWSAPIPRCIKDNCEKNLPLPFHGVIIEKAYESPENMTGYLITSCKIGYINNTDTRMECRNSEWVGQTPECFKGNYDVEIEDIRKGVLLEHATLTIRESHTLHLSCRLENDLNEITEFRKYPENEVVDGPQIGEMLIGNVSVNDEGVYSCLNQEEDVLQSLNVKVIRRCPDLKYLHRGHMIAHGHTAMGYYEGVRVYFGCEDGYSLSGDHMCICKDGSWVGVIPICLPDIEVIVESDPLTSVDEVLFQYEGGEIILTCTIQSKYEIADLRRKYNLKWTFIGVVETEKIFFQQAMFKEGLRLRLPKVTVDHSGFYICGTANTQKSIYVNVSKRCIDDHVLPNGLKTLNDEPGRQSINFSCNPLFSLSGSSHRECLPTGEWSGVRPTCTGMRLELA